MFNTSRNISGFSALLFFLSLFCWFVLGNVATSLFLSSLSFCVLGFAFMCTIIKHNMNDIQNSADDAITHAHIRMDEAKREFEDQIKELEKQIDLNK